MHTYIHTYIHISMYVFRQLYVEYIEYSVQYIVRKDTINRRNGSYPDFTTVFPPTVSPTFSPGWDGGARETYRLFFFFFLGAEYRSS